MIDVTNETKTAFLTDSTPKSLDIEFDEYTPENINFFTKTGFYGIRRTYVDFTEDGEQESRFFFRRNSDDVNGELIRLTDCVDHTYYENYKYWYYSFYPKLDKDDDLDFEGGTADITLKDVEIGLVYYIKGTYTTMYFPIDNSHLPELRNETYWMKFATERIIDTFNDNNKLWELCIKVTVKAENVRLNSGSDHVRVFWGGKADNIMFTLSDTPPESYVYPSYIPSSIINNEYPALYAGGIESIEDINYFTGKVAIMQSKSYTDISNDGNYILWDELYYYAEKSTTPKYYFEDTINYDRFDQFSYCYASVYAKFIDYGITKGTANVTFTGPLRITFFYTVNGQNRSRYHDFTDETLINQFVNGEFVRLYVNIPVPFTHKDENNYMRHLDVRLYTDYSDVVIDAGEAYIRHSYDIIFDDFMFNLSNIPPRDYVFHQYTRSQIVDGVYPLMNIHNENLVSESFKLTESVCSRENLKFGLSESANCSFTVAGRDEKYTDRIFRAYITCNDTQKLPLGRFKVHKVTRKAKYKLVTKNIVAYDEMFDWDKDATDWYSDYMFGISSDDYTFGGYEFARQMFSTYYNFARFMGYENDGNYVDELIYESELLRNTAVAQRHYKYVKFTRHTTVTNPPSDIECTNRGDMQKFEINDISSDYLYKFEKYNLFGFDDDEIWKDYTGPSNKDYNSKKGLLKKGSVMVEEVLDDGTYNRYLVDAGDYFAVSDNCVKLNIYYAIHTIWEDAGSSGITSSFIDYVYVYRTPCPDWLKLLVNKSARLVYYDWETLDWEAPTCTVRDIFRSLMELNGAFVKINREGNMQCVYSRKGSLYPSETLYPSENLYPIEEAVLVPKSRYIDCQHEDYESADFGKIQIKSNNNNKDAITIRTYVGDADWIEAGDRVTLLTNDDAFESYVFRRTLKGIQSLKDTYEAHGDDVIESYKEVEV